MTFNAQRFSGLVAAGLLSVAFALPAHAADLEAGKKIFEEVCAACHGTTGRPDPNNPTVAALDPQPADLSDPLFNSREPEEDWNIVVTHGGPALGLSAVMPSQKAALKEDEIRNVVAYAKTLAPGSELYPPGELNFFLPVRTKKAFPEDEIVLKGRFTDAKEGDNPWRSILEVEKRFGKRSMGVLEVVYEDDGEDAEVTMVEAGAKTVVHWNKEKGSILSVALVYGAATQSGESDEVIPYLAYGKRLSERSTLQSSGRVIVPVDDADEGEVELASVVHYEWTVNRQAMFPALEVTATVPFDAGDGDSVQWTAVPQVRVGLTRGGHVALNAGIEFPLSDQSYETRYHLVLLWDFADGSFFKGW
jgi:mono/diheme cytochrome c family protein